MKTPWLYPAVVLAGGFSAFLLRLVQNRTAFELGTGLPIPGHPAALALLVFLPVLLVVLILLSRSLLPDERNRTLPFPVSRPGLLVLPVAGSFLLALAGACDLWEGFGGEDVLDTLFPQPVGIPTTYYVPSMTGSAFSMAFTGGAQALSGLLLLGSAAGLLMTAACNSPNRRSLFRPALTLLAPTCMVVRLYLIQREESLNPLLETCVVNLLALAVQALGFYNLCTFAFQEGNLRRFGYVGGYAVAFSLCALADKPAHASALLIHLGCSLCLLGFFLLALSAAGAVETASPETDGGAAAADAG